MSMAVETSAVVAAAKTSLFVAEEDVLEMDE